MKWKRATKNYVEDGRGAGGGGGGLGGGGGGLQIPLPRGGAGAGAGGLGLIILLVVIALQIFGGGLFGGGGGGGGGDTGATVPDPNQIQAPPADGQLPDTEDELVAFVQSVVQDIQETWKDAFAASGKTYEETTLRLFEGGVNTECGSATSAVGPFYCPADHKVYLDLSFFQELRDKFGAPGDFAQAYVIAHEFGHHVQTLLGISDQVRQSQQANPDQANALSVRMELQADCFAGVWAHSVWAKPGEGVVYELDATDIKEGLEAAASVGDDRLQSAGGGQVNPEAFTHGTSEQRMEWFQKGFDKGNADACDTFADIR